MAMLEREVRDFRRVVLELMQKTGSTFQQANQDAVNLLGVVSPFDGGALPKMPASKTRRRPGTPNDAGLSKRDAVAAVAVYFESVGAGKEQAINEAKRWLNISLSRRVAKHAVSALKSSVEREYFQTIRIGDIDQVPARVHACWAYLTFKPGTTQPLPDIVIKVRKKRQTKRG